MTFIFQINLNLMFMLLLLFMYAGNFILDFSVYETCYCKESLVIFIQSLYTCESYIGKLEIFEKLISNCLTHILFDIL